MGQFSVEKPGLPGSETDPPFEMARSPYSVLLRMGFTMPLPLPVARCALTAPFHPYPEPKPKGGLLSVALSLGSPPPDVIRRRFSVEPGLSSVRRRRPSSRLTDLR